MRLRAGCRTTKSRRLRSNSAKLSGATGLPVGLHWEIGRRIRQDILPHMGELTPLADTMSEEKKFAVIQREFDRLYDRRHPVRNQVETLDSVEVVKINRDVLKR